MKKQPTPLSTWKSAITSAFPITGETGQSAISLHTQISQYLSTGCSKFTDSLQQGTIPQTFSDGIQFYIDYIFRIIHVELTDKDVLSSADHQFNMIDALSEYSLGIMITVLRTVSMHLYNPTSGVLRSDGSAGKKEWLE